MERMRVETSNVTYLHVAEVRRKYNLAATFSITERAARVLINSNSRGTAAFCPPKTIEQGLRHRYIIWFK